MQVSFFADALSQETQEVIATSVFQKQEESPVKWYIQWITDQDIHPGLLIERLAHISEQHNIPLTTLSADSLRFEDIPDDIDWLAESYKGFQPFHIGQFFIYGSHHQDDIPAGYIPLQIDASTAFGSGEHATTASCLAFAEHLHRKGFKPQSIIDIGTGSGILAIAAHKLWLLASCYASDIDPASIDLTEKHILLNNIQADSIQTILADGTNDVDLQNKAPFDLVFANILAGPLIDMAANIASFVAPNGKLVLSGLLNTQKDDVVQAYENQNLTFVAEIEKDDWMALLLERHDNE